MAVVATLTKGYDLDYIWHQVDHDPTRDAASYYIQASEAGGEPPGRWWGPGAQALGLEPGTMVDREPYDLLFGERKAPDGTPLGRPPDRGRKAAGIYTKLLEAEPHATAERKHELRLDATRQARQSPLFFDLTLSLSKSISLFHASLGENARLARQAGDRDGDEYWTSVVAEVDAMIWQAVRAGFDYLQREAGYTRTGSHNKRVNGRETGQWHEADLAVAHWLQHTSRDGDMQLHVHSQIAHVAKTATDGKWRAPDSLGYNEHVGAVAAITAQHLEEALTQRFGLEWTARDDGHGFEIKGISGEMMRLFSSRRQSITADLRERADRFEQRYGRAPSQRELAQLAQASNFRTRKGKEGALDFAQLHAGWADTLTRTLGVSLASVAPSVWHASTGRATTHPSATDDAEAAARRGLDLARAAQKAVALAQQEKSTWTRADLVKYLGRVLPRTGMDPQEAAALLEDLADRALHSEFEPVTCLEAPESADVPRSLLRNDGRSVYQRHGGVRYATRAQLTMEEHIIAQASAEGAPRLTRAAAAHALGADLTRLERALEGRVPDTQDAHAHDQKTGSGLREDQAAAAMSVLTDGKRVSVINAPAGSGKTRVLAEFARAWQDAGIGKAIGVTPSQSARNTLAAGVAESYNSAQFLGHLPGKRGARGPVKTGPRPLLLVDEASMIPGPDLADLVSFAEANDGKLVLAGDTAQLQAVQNGGGMSLLADKLGYVQLTEPVRFTAAWERAASLRLRTGDTSVLADYDQHARIRGGDPEQMMDAAATTYVALTTAGTDALLMAADHATRRELSRRIRDDLLRLGLVQPGPTITIADGTPASPGDLIIATRNDHSTEAGQPGRTLANGDLLRIEAITKHGPLVRRALDADRETGQRRWTDRQFLFPGYRESELGYAVTEPELGYAVTDHVAQGRTVHTALAVITGNEDRQHGYVALTRGTTVNMAFVFTVSPKLADPAPGPRPAPELARHDRLTAPEAGTVPGEQAATGNPLGVLSGVLERDGQLLSATQARQQALSDADHLGILNAIWTAETTPARTQRYRDLYMEALPPEYQQEPGHQAKWLWQALHAAELAGLDPAEALATAVGQRDLIGARDIPSVINARLRHQLEALAPIPAAPWAQQLPEIPDPDCRAYAAQIATQMDERKDRIGAHAAATAPTWAVTALGPVPDDQPERQEWQQRAASIGAWRELSGHDHPTDPIGPEPATGSPDLRSAWHEARTALGPADTPDVRAMPDGTLLHLRDTYPIETAWAPPWRGDELRQARTAAWDARVAALRATAEAGTAARHHRRDEATRQRALAASYQALHQAYQQREAALADAMADRATWEEATRQQRHLALAADAELRRRHPAQHHPPMRSAEPQPATKGQRDERAPSAADHITRTAELIAELAAQRRDFARHFAEWNAQIPPPGNSRHPDLDAVPLARTAQVSDAILQPPKPPIQPSARIVERVTDRDLEAAD